MRCHLLYRKDIQGLRKGQERLFRMSLLSALSCHIATYFRAVHHGSETVFRLSGLPRLVKT